MGGGKDYGQRGERNDAHSLEDSGGRFGQLINDGLKGGWRDRLAFRFSSVHPHGFCSENCRQSFFRSLAESRAASEIRDVRNVAAVFFAVEDVDVIVLHSSPPRDRLYRSTRASNCLTW